MMSGIVSHQPEVASGTSGTRMPSPATSRMNPTRMRFAGRPLALRPARIATKNMLSDSGAIDSPASRALYSSTICRYSGSTIMVPPSAICCISCPLTPDWKTFDLKSTGSISVALPRFLRLTSHQAKPSSAMMPSPISSATYSPPSCHTRMPRTMPPMPITESTAPPQSTTREPVYLASFTSAMPESTIAITTASPANPTRQDHSVVMRPPRSGPTAAAIAADAPTRA